jgi:tetratricopeptide (TPR) repeat protein
VKTGKTDEAGRIYWEATELVDRLIQANPEEQGYREIALAGRADYGTYLLNTGRIPDAEQALSEAVKMAQKLVDDFPNWVTYQRNLVGAWLNLGNMFWTTGRPEKALKYLVQGRKAAQNLVDDYPTVPECRSLLGTVLNNLAMLHDRLGQPAEARLLLEKAIEHQQQALHPNPNHRKYREFLKNHVLNLALVLEEIHAPTAELDQAHQRGIELAKTLAKDHAGVPDYQSGVGAALNNWAGLLKRRGHNELARPLLEEAVLFQQKALQANPKNPIYVEYLRNHYMHLAETLKALRQPEAAMACRDWITAAWQLAMIAPQKNNWEVVIAAIDQSERVGANDCFFMAMAHAHLAKTAAAHQWYDMAVAAMEKTQPDDPRLRRLRTEAEELLEIKKK